MNSDSSTREEKLDRQIDTHSDLLGGSAPTPMVPLGDIVCFIDGDRGANYPKKDEFSNSGYCAFLNTGNVTRHGFDFSSVQFITKEKDELLRKGRIALGDIVYTTRGTVGNVGLYQRSVFDSVRINSGMVIIRPDKSRVDAKYLFHILTSDLHRGTISAISSGSSQPQLPISALARAPIPLPALSIQKEISSTLGLLDDKIDLNRQLNDNLAPLAP